jgi:ribosomal protein S18 acetylase RimI-like enzyme
MMRLLRIALDGALWLPGPLELRRSLQAADYARQAHASVSLTPHWYLWVLGVEPEQQGRGTGSQLLQRVLLSAGAQRVPCYLETENPRNIPFYQKHGFRLIREMALVQSDVRIYALLWKPE